MGGIYEKKNAKRIFFVKKYSILLSIYLLYTRYIIIKFFNEKKYSNIKHM